jgi:DNA polymerase III sliding clamp (beta) subunit (PCNA family)
MTKERSHKLIATVNHKEFLNAAKNASLAAARETSVLPLKGLLIEADKRTGTMRMTSSDLVVFLSVSLPARIAKSGGAVVSGTGPFLEYLSIAPKGNLVFEADKDERTLTIRTEGENRRLDIRTFPTSEYPKPEIPMPGETVYVAGLKSLIARTAFLASGSDAEGSAKCVKLTLTDGGIAAEAANRFTIAKTKGDPEAKGDASMIVPAEALKILARVSGDKDVFEIGIAGGGEGGKNAVFFDGATLLSARLSGDKVPDTEVLLGAVKEAARVKVRAKEFLSALEIATALAPKSPLRTAKYA